MLNLAVRQCLLEFLHARVGDLGAVEVQLVELGQPLEVFQSSVRDLGALEAQLSELCQSFNALQPGVADLSAAEVQRLELGQPLEVSSPASPTLVLSSVSFGVRLPFEIFQPCVADPGVV